MTRSSSAVRLPQFRTTAAVQFRRVPLNPTPDRDVIHAEVALRHDFFQIPQAEAEPEIPPDAQDDDLGFKMPSLKQRWPVPSHAVQSVSVWPEHGLQHIGFVLCSDELHDAVADEEIRLATDTAAAASGVSR